MHVYTHGCISLCEVVQMGTAQTLWHELDHVFERCVCIKKAALFLQKHTSLLNEKSYVLDENSI